jgi:hypothetical protein
MPHVGGDSSDGMSRTVDLHIMEVGWMLEVDPANPRRSHTV